MRLPLLTTALILILAAAAPARVFDEATLKPSGLGPLKIGMTEAEVEGVIARNVNQSHSAGSECGTARLDGRNYMLFTDDVLRRVTLASRQYAVKESGLRVGDKESTIKDFYANRAKRSQHVYVRDGSYFDVTGSGGKQIRFETDGKKITQIHAGAVPEVQYVEACS